MMASPSPEYYDTNWGKDPRQRLDYVFRSTWPGEKRYQAFFDWWYGKAPALQVPEADNGEYAAPDAAYLHWIGEHVDTAELRAGRLPKVLLDAQAPMVEHFRQRPYEQDLFVLDEASGKQAFIAPHFPSVHSLPGNAPPPAADGKGGVFIPEILTHPVLQLRRQVWQGAQ